MLMRLLRSDVRRTATTSAVLCALIAVAALLAAVGGSVLVQLTGAIDKLFTVAHTPDVVQMHAGPLNEVDVERWAVDRPEVAGWQVVETLPVSTERLFLGEDPQSGSVLQPALVTQNADFDLLLDLDNNVLEVDDGEIAMPLYYRQNEGVEIGDQVSVRVAEDTFDFTVVDFVRDSMMNPTFATSKRLLISDVDHAEIAGLVDSPEYLVEFVLNDRGQTKAVSDDYSDTGPGTSGPLLDRGTFFLLNAVSHGIGIGVLSFLAVLMLAVAAIALRFSFLTAIERDAHEIGVMKAVGIPERRIRRLYLSKYVALAVVGGILGAAASVPVARALTASLRLQLGDPDGSLWMVVGPAAGAALVVLAVVGWCALMLRRLARISTMDALRAGTASGSARPRRRWLRRRRSTRRADRPSRTRHWLTLSTTRLPAAIWMGLNGIRRSLPTHRMLLAVLTLCTFLILVPLNLWTTVTSPGFVTYLGTGVADLRLELRSDDAAALAPQVAAALDEDPEIAGVASFVTARFEVQNTDGEWEQLTVEMGDHDVFPLSYIEGTHPTTPSEISLSSLAAESLAVEPGDTFTVAGTNDSHDVTLVGIYQDLTNGGRTAKGLLPVDGEPIQWRTMLLEATDGTEPAGLADRLSADYPEVQVIEMAEFAEQTLGDLITQTGNVAAAAGVIATVLAALIATLFAQMVVARDRSQIAVQRGLGVSDRALRLQYLTRFVVVLIAGIVLGTVLVATAGRWLVASAIGRLGAPALQFTVDPLLAYGAVPLLLTVTVTIAAAASTTSFSDFGLSHMSEE